MTVVRKAFRDTILALSLDRILPTRVVSKETLQSVKFQKILASIKEVGIVEPLAVHPERGSGGRDAAYILLDGHLRFEALKVLGHATVECLISTDDEGFL